MISIGLLARNHLASILSLNKLYRQPINNTLSGSDGGSGGWQCALYLLGLPLSAFSSREMNLQDMRQKWKQTQSSCTIATFISLSVYVLAIVLLFLGFLNQLNRYCKLRLLLNTCYNVNQSFPLFFRSSGNRCVFELFTSRHFPLFRFRLSAKQTRVPFLRSQFFFGWFGLIPKHPVQNAVSKKIENFRCNKTENYFFHLKEINH